MTFEEAVELFYTDEEIASQFNYWEIDGIIATAQTFISDVEDILKEREN